MPILRCGAELARVMEVSDTDVQAIEDQMERLTSEGVPLQEAQRLAVSRLLEDLQVSARAEPVAGPVAGAAAPAEQFAAQPAGTAQLPQEPPLEGATRFSRSPQTRAIFEERIDALYAGDKPRAQGVRILDRSDMLGFLGMGEGPVHLVESKVEQGRFNHGLSAADWKKVPEWLDNPAAVFDSDTQPGRLVFIAPDMVRGAPVRMIIDPRPDGDGVNLLINAYDAERNPFDRWARDGLLRFVDRQKTNPASSSFQSRLTGLQGKQGPAPSAIPGLKNLELLANGAGKILTEKQLGGWRRANPAQERMRRGSDDPAMNGIPRAEADALVARINAAGLRRLALVESPADLPISGQRRIESEGITGVRGMYSPAEDMVYLVRQNLQSADEVLFTVMHEAFHRGLRKTIPAVGPVLDQIYLTNPRVRAAADRYAEQHNISKQEATEEVLADTAGQGIVRDIKGWDRLVKTIRDWLDRVARAAGVEMTWTDDMVMDLVAGARQAGIEADVRAEQGEARFRRDDSADGDGGPPAQRDLEYEPNPWNTPEPTKLDSLIYNLQDTKVDLKRVQEAIKATGQEIEEGFDARMAETLYPGRVAKRNADFLSVEVKPLLEAMARNGVSMDELSDFLLARHAPERNAQIAKINEDLPDGGAGTNSKGELMTTAAAEAYIEDMAPARRTLLQMLARQVDSITAGTRNILVSEGLESAETVAAWQGAYTHYVPLFRDEAAEGGVPLMNQRSPHPQGSGFSVRGKSSKRATGSTKEVTNMLAHVLMQREAAMTRAEKNRVGMALYGLALSHPNPGFWTVIRPDMSNAQIQAELERVGVDPLTVANMEAAPTVRTVNPATNQVETHTNPMYRTMANALTVKIAGEDRVIMFNEMDPRAARLAEALKNLDGLTKLDLAGSIVGKSTRWLASVNTQYNPAFGIVNATRDALGAAINLGSTALRGQGLRVLADTPRALAGVAAHLSGKKGGEWAKLYEQYQNDGAQTGFKEMFRDANERTKRIERELKAAQRAGTLTPGRAAHAALDLLDGFNTTMENGIRLAAYKAALDKGMSRPAAAKLARELTVDFNRKGRVGRELGPLYAFFNASVQGSARTLQTLAGPTGRRVLIGGLAVGVLQSMMLAAAGYEEDEISEFVKTRNFIIPLGDKKWAAIPLPLGLHVLPNTGRVLADLATGDRKDASKKVGDAIGEILGAFNPMGGGNVLTTDGALKTIAPTLVDPLIELNANKNFAGAPIEKRYDEQRDSRPGFTRARESTQRTLTGQAYIGISEAINSMTGGNDFEAGLASPSPERVRYLAQTVGGGLLRELEKTINLASPSENARSSDAMTGIPLLGRFSGRVDDRQVQQSRYFRNVERAEKLESSMRAAENAGAREALRDMASRPEARIIAATNEVQREVAKLNKLAVQTINDPEKLRRIDEARYQAQLKMNEAIRRLEAETEK